MTLIHDISVDVVNEIPMREDGINKIDQTSKYTILNNGEYYVHHDCDKNQKLREIMEVTCPWYGHGECSFKLTMQMFIYNILTNKNRRGFGVNFDVVRSTIQVGKKINLIENPKYESRKN